MIADVLGHYNMAKECDLDLIYNGPLWSDGIEGLGRTLRKRVEIDELPLSVCQSVFSVFVEQMNNMLMYAADNGCLKSSGGGVPKGVFLLGTRGRTYVAQCGNVMESANVDFIKTRIDYLNTLDKEELRRYYKEMIKKENLGPGSKGGGLGLIEIAKRSKSPIQYEFSPYGEGLTFFSMYVEIG